MYNFSYFKEKDQQAILEFIEAHPFAFLTGSTLMGEQVATQIPVIFEERNGELYLQGHLMRNTYHQKVFKFGNTIENFFTKNKKNQDFTNNFQTKIVSKVINRGFAKI